MTPSVITALNRTYLEALSAGIVAGDFDALKGKFGINRASAWALTQLTEREREQLIHSWRVLPVLDTERLSARMLAGTGPVSLDAVFRHPSWYSHLCQTYLTALYAACQSDPALACLYFGLQRDVLQTLLRQPMDQMAVALADRQVPLGPVFGQNVQGWLQQSTTQRARSVVMSLAAGVLCSG